MRYGAISLADSGVITFQTNGSVSASGTSGTMTLSSGAGGTAGAGGSLTLQSANGGSTSGAGGPLQLSAGSAVGSTGGKGGDVSLTAGNAAGTGGGAGGSVTLTAGNGAGTNQAGGSITLSSGTPTGSGTPGGITLTAASSASSTGANVILTAGAGSVLANDGFVQVSRVPVSNRAARLRFLADDATTVDLKAPASATSYALTLPTAQGGTSTFLQNNGSGTLSWAAGNAGTVTTISIVTANGFAGTVATATTTPAITLTTSVTGVIVGNGTSMAAAAAATTTDTAIVTWNGSAANNLRNNTLTISGQTISTPAAAAGNAVNITGGAGSSTTGGNVVITGGAPTGANTPGAVSISGAAAAGATTGGLVTLAGGDSTTNLGGNVVLRGGRGSVVANDGFIQIDRTTTDNRATRLRFVSDNAGTVDIKAPSAVTSYAMTWPGAVAAVANTPLQSSAAGVLSWSTSGTVRQTLFTEIAANTTTTSLTFVALLSQAITTIAGTALSIHFTVAGEVSTNNRTTAFQLLVDGTAVRGTGYTLATSNVPGSAALVYRSTGLAAGAHTIAVQWRVLSATTASILPVTNIYEHASLLVQEVSP